MLVTMALDLPSRVVGEGERLYLDTPTRKCKVICFNLRSVHLCYHSDEYSQTGERSCRESGSLECGRGG